MILIGCEESQTITRAFRNLGYEAYSCDIQNTSGDNPEWHLQMDVFEALKLKDWKLLIAHPPCTYISYAGTRYWNQDGRAGKRIEALSFFLKLWEAKIDHICIENPLGVADNVIKKHDQIIHPYYFGDEFLKRTCLWLKNLPVLQYEMEDNLFSKRTSTEYPEPIYVDRRGKKRHFTEGNSGGFNRSKSFPGIANAMATQWGSLL